MEVYRIIYEGPDELKVFGTIDVTDDVNHNQYIYNQDENVTIPPIQPWEDVLLTDPTMAPISFKNSSSIILLFRLCADFFFDVVHYYSFPPEPEMLSVPLYDKVLSRDCTKKLHILSAAFEEATKAIVKMTIFMTDDTSVVDIEGIVASSTSAIQHPDYISFLFYRKPDNTAQVKSGEDLPFCRSIVVAPLNSQLSFDISLCSPDKGDIFRGSLMFNVQEIDTMSQDIYGKNFTIKVQVTWG